MTKKKWIFCNETTYLKILKEKAQLQASQPSHDSDYLGIGRTWEKFPSLPAKKPRKFETATGKENF